MQIVVSLPCTAHELECALHRIAHEGHWGDCRIHGVYAKQTHRHAIVFDYGNESSSTRTGKER